LRSIKSKNRRGDPCGRLIPMSIPTTMQNKNENQTSKRKSIRLRDFDYSKPGFYFVTICSHNKECVFGEIDNGEMILNDIGKIINEEILSIPKRFKNVEIDIYAIMPNHVHMILSILCDDDLDCCDDGNRRGGVSPPEISTPGQNCRGAVSAPETENILMQGGGNSGGETPPLRKNKPTLGQVVGYFKYHSTKKINIVNNTPSKPVFQRNYYEHIIRNEESYAIIYAYIESNPQTWDRDMNNPANATIP